MVFAVAWSHFISTQFSAEFIGAAFRYNSRQSQGGSSFLKAIVLGDGLFEGYVYLFSSHAYLGVFSKVSICRYCFYVRGLGFLGYCVRTWGAYIFISIQHLFVLTWSFLVSEVNSFGSVFLSLRSLYSSLFFSFHSVSRHQLLFTSHVDGFSGTVNWLFPVPVHTTTFDVQSFSFFCMSIWDKGELFEYDIGL